jgi:hypothetical protein
MDPTGHLATTPIPTDARAAWELWKWMQDLCDKLWNSHADSFLDFDDEEYAEAHPRPQASIPPEKTMAHSEKSDWIYVRERDEGR